MTQNETVSPKTQVFTDIRVIFTDFIRLDVLGFFCNPQVLPTTDHPVGLRLCFLGPGRYFTYRPF